MTRARRNFSTAASPTAEAEKALKKWKIPFTKRADDTLLVEGNFDISSRNLTYLPDLSCVIVRGNFNCTGNQLTSLEGAPRSVGGDFMCSVNQLTSLVGAPQSVKNFRCTNNQLNTLQGAPQSVDNSFVCYSNQLTTLKGAPQSVHDNFNCTDNPLTSLEDAPQIFRHLQSDFGDFASWNEVPEKLKISPETKARHHQQFLHTTDFSRGLSKPMPLPPSPFAKKH